MNQLSTCPPAERDLPPGRSAELRAQVMQYVDAPRRSIGARLAPVAAATAVLAVAGGTALVVQDQRSGSGGSPATSTGSTAATGARTVSLDDATLARKCAPRSQVLVRFDDAFGTYAVVRSHGAGSKGTVFTDCFVSPRGSVDRTSWNPDTLIVGPLKDKVALMSYGDFPTTAVRSPLGCMPVDAHPGLCSSDNEHYVFGLVASDVGRVVVTWRGRSPITAAVRHGYFAARSVDTKSIAPGDPTPTVRAYDKNGHLVGKVSTRYV